MPGPTGPQLALPNLTLSTVILVSLVHSLRQSTLYSVLARRALSSFKASYLRMSPHTNPARNIHHRLISCVRDYFTARTAFLPHPRAAVHETDYDDWETQQRYRRIFGALRLPILDGMKRTLGLARILLTD